LLGLFRLEVDWKVVWFEADLIRFWFDFELFERIEPLSPSLGIDSEDMGR
jgi:hypothetical protein